MLGCHSALHLHTCYPMSTLHPTYTTLHLYLTYILCTPHMPSTSTLCTPYLYLTYILPPHTPCTPHLYPTYAMHPKCTVCTMYTLPPFIPCTPHIPCILYILHPTNILPPTVYTLHPLAPTHSSSHVHLHILYSMHPHTLRSPHPPRTPTPARGLCLPPLTCARLCLPQQSGGGAVPGGERPEGPGEAHGQ